MAHMHHPVDRAADHVFQNGPWTDRPTVPIIVRIPFDPEISVVPSLIAIHGSHTYALTARFLELDLVCLTVVSFGMIEINS